MVLVIKKYEVFLFALMKSNDCKMVLFVCSLHRNSSKRLECFGAFIVYMPTVSNVNITFGCIQFVTHKSSVNTCINFMAGLGTK